jgi:hypothetical protein
VQPAIEAKDRRPLLAAAVVLALYAVWAVAVTSAGDPIRLAYIGEHQLDRGRGASTAIDSLTPTSPHGYDGQYVAFIALDPANAYEYIEWPPYRYARILYPAFARALSLGDIGALGWTLLLINVAAAALLTYSAAVFLTRFGASPWYALIVGLSPSLAAGVARDLTEPLAYALAALGMVLVSATHPRILAATIAFALAGLTRETALLFAVAVAAGLWFGLLEAGRNRRAALILLAGSLAPAVLLRIVLPFLVPNVGPGGLPFDPIPLGGLFGRTPFGRPEQQALIAVAIPGCLALLLALLLARRVSAALIALTLNVAVLVIFLDSGGYDHLFGATRLTLGVVVALVLALNAIPAGRRRLLVALTPTVLWSLAWLSLQSEVLTAMS